MEPQQPKIPLSPALGSAYQPLDVVFNSLQIEAEFFRTVLDPSAFRSAWMAITGNPALGFPIGRVDPPVPAVKGFWSVLRVVSDRHSRLRHMGTDRGSRLRHMGTDCGSRKRFGLLLRLFRDSSRRHRLGNISPDLQEIGMRLQEKKPGKTPDGKTHA
jgi:hypothetical protein